MSAHETAAARPLTGAGFGAERVKERVFEGLLLLSLLLALGFLVVLVTDILSAAIPVFQERGLGLITEKVSSRISRTGMRQALVGSFQIAFTTAVVAFPLGVATAIYLEEYAPDTWFTRLIDINIRNLAGVPSVVYGILGFFLFTTTLSRLTGGNTALSAGLTMALLALPIVVIASAESIRAVPDSLRQAGYGLGSTRWQVTRKLVLPSAVPGIMTGTILALARAIGETAPLLVVGVSAFITLDSGLLDFRQQFMALPSLIFNWTKVPQREFVDQAAPAAILVLLLFTLSMNAIAIFVRNRFERRG